MTEGDQIMVMLESFELVRERLCLDFLIEELRTDIGRTDYYDYAERSAKAWLVKELSGEETDVPSGPHGKDPAIPTLAVAQQHALIPT